MKSVIVSFFVIAVVALMSVQLSSAVQCYECNSKFDKYCKDILSYTDILPPQYIKNCTELETGEIKYEFCRKMEQNVDGDKRTLRMCASHETKERCVERTGTKDIKLKYCLCDARENNLCNTAFGLTSNKITILSIFSLILALVLHL